MNVFDFNNKCFRLVNNSIGGEAGSDTIFYYKQKGEMVMAEYSGGPIEDGKIIARLEGDVLQMRYICYTKERQLCSGAAVANISLNNEGKIVLQLNWKWLDKAEHGKSTYQEI